MRQDVRRSIGIKQNMAIAQLLGIRAVRKVLLQAVLADVRGFADRRDGRLVDEGGAVFFCHVCLCVLSAPRSIDWICIRR